jgi:hypothetical protein
MSKLPRWGAAAALLCALDYLSLFLFYGAWWQYPATADAAGQWQYINKHATALFFIHLSYLIFGIALAVLVQALYVRLKPIAPQRLLFARWAGLLWVTYIVAAGMIANIALKAVLDLGATDPEKAMQLLKTLSYVVDGLGGGNELPGGLWSLLVGLVSWRAGLPRWLAVLAIVIGLAGIATVFPDDSAKAVFGLCQIVWFVGVAVVLWRDRSGEDAAQANS